MWKTGEDGLCCSSSAIQTRLGPSSLIEERSEIPIVFVATCVVGYPSNWGKRPTSISTAYTLAISPSLGGGGGVANNSKETTKTMGISFRSSSNDEGPSRDWIALLEQHSPSSPVFHNLHHFIDTISPRYVDIMYVPPGLKGLKVTRITRHNFFRFFFETTVT